MSNLKPCPFCGGEAEQKELIDFWEHYYFVKCKKCGSTTPCYYGKDKNIEAWNRRAENENK